MSKNADAIVELKSRLHTVIKGYTSLLHPHLDPCFELVKQLRQQLAGDIVRRADDIERQAIQGKFATAAEFRDALRALLLGQEVACVEAEHTFEESVLAWKLDSPPAIREFSLRWNGLSKSDKAAAMNAVRTFEPDRVQGTQITFVPDKLRIATQRRLVLLAARAALPADSKKRDRSSDKLRPEVRTAPPSTPVPSRVSAPDDDFEDDGLFQEILKQGNGAQPLAASEKRPVLEQNPHTHGDYIADLSPAGSVASDG